MERIGREVRVLQHLPRWSIVRTIRTQSVAEHTLMVCHLTERFMDFLMNLPPQIEGAAFARNIVQNQKSEILIAAMYHDLPEILSGDVAHPAKTAYRLAPGAKDAYRDWEESRMRERFPWFKETEDPWVRSIIGLMDLLEAKIFLTEELRMGNREVEVVHGAIHVKLNEMSAAFQGRWRIDPDPFLDQASSEAFSYDMTVNDAR